MSTTCYLLSIFPRWGLSLFWWSESPSVWSSQGLNHCIGQRGKRVSMEDKMSDVHANAVRTVLETGSAQAEQKFPSMLVLSSPWWGIAQNYLVHIIVNFQRGWSVHVTFTLGVRYKCHGNYFNDQGHDQSQDLQEVIERMDMNVCHSRVAGTRTYGFWESGWRFTWWTGLERWVSSLVHSLRSLNVEGVWEVASEYHEVTNGSESRAPSNRKKLSQGLWVNTSAIIRSWPNYFDVKKNRGSVWKSRRGWLSIAARFE